MTGRMAGRRILIVGGGTGIGRATALRCAEEGARVTVVGRRKEPLEEVAGLTGGHAIAADARVEADIMAAVDTAADMMGGLDGVANVLGVGSSSRFEDVDLAAWEAGIAANLTAPFLVCRAALPHLRRASDGLAAIVNVAALAGILPGVSSVAYSAAKGGLVQFSRTLAAQLAPAIRVNCVSPGVVETPMIDAFLADKTEEQRAAFVARYAIGRMADPVEIAQVILFLLSTEASNIIGSNYVVDGGRAYY